MPSITLKADGTVSDVNFEGQTTKFEPGVGVTASQDTIGDPNKVEKYSDEQLAAALEHTQGEGSSEQAELNRMRDREAFCLNKANEIASYNADGSPVYARSESERKQLLAQAKGLREGLPLQLIMSNRSIATRWLDKQAELAKLAQTAADHDALEARATAIVAERQANELADLMQKRKISGQR
jgi:hypothetical protein